MKVMTPVAKVGILHTTAKTGFDERKAQSVIKISQDMITKSKRGKNAKVKGLILFKGLSKIGNRNYGNVFILDTDVFVSAVFKLAKVLGKK
jgi:endonuclease III